MSTRPRLPRGSRHHPYIGIHVENVSETGRRCFRLGVPGTSKVTANVCAPVAVGPERACTLGRTQRRGGAILANVFAGEQDCYSSGRDQVWREGRAPRACGRLGDRCCLNAQAANVSMTTVRTRRWNASGGDCVRIRNSSGDRLCRYVYRRPTDSHLCITMSATVKVDRCIRGRSDDTGGDGRSVDGSVDRGSRSCGGGSVMEGTPVSAPRSRARTLTALPRLAPCTRTPVTRPRTATLTARTMCLVACASPFSSSCSNARPTGVAVQ